MCRLDPSQVKKLFNAIEFKNQDRYKQSYNAGPMRFLPVAYPKKGGRKARNTKKEELSEESKEESEKSEDIVKPVAQLQPQEEESKEQKKDNK